MSSAGAPKNCRRVIIFKFLKKRFSQSRPGNRDNVVRTAAMENSLRFAMAFVLAAVEAAAQQPTQQNAFAKHCAGCHGDDARGTAKAPALAMNPRVAEQSAEQLRSYLERGNPGAGMPSFPDLTPDEMASVTRFLERI